MKFVSKVISFVILVAGSVVMLMMSVGEIYAMEDPMDHGPFAAEEGHMK